MAKALMFLLPSAEALLQALQSARLFPEQASMLKSVSRSTRTCLDILLVTNWQTMVRTQDLSNTTWDIETFSIPFDIPNYPLIVSKAFGAIEMTKTPEVAHL